MLVMIIYSTAPLVKYIFGLPMCTKNSLNIGFLLANWHSLRSDRIILDILHLRILNPVKRRVLMMGYTQRIFSLRVLFLVVLFARADLFAQGTLFTYQGRLNDNGRPANGTYDLTFTIYDSTNVPGNKVEVVS